MKITSILKYFGLSIIATASFYTTYYIGLLVDKYAILMLICGGIVNIILMSAKDFSVWAEKSIIFTFFVLTFAVFFQSIDMHLLMVDFFSLDLANIKWGTRQLIINSMWFGQGMLTLLISLIISLIASHLENNKYVE